MVRHWVSEGSCYVTLDSRRRLWLEWIEESDCDETQDVRM